MNKGELLQGCLKRRLVEYFNANPEEELTSADVSAKFGVTQETAKEAFIALHRAGRLQLVHTIKRKDQP